MNIQIPTGKNTKIIEKDLSYKIVGLLYEVHTKLGGRYQEKIYQKAVEKVLQREKINYQRELPVDLIFEGAKIGKYYLDFLIEERVILELKAVYRFHPEHFRQVQSYLKTNNIKLGILANFKGPKLIYARILNS
ncbi:MAG: GxxExxY protein [Patescibacteria group bacterium]|nr:GxxExxY protein [Patescibacteria group bacterium]MCL5432210.1 GxxExxY protein [Patescibacteria group bacterium]